MTDRPTLAISFSGGRTSAVMAPLCLQEYSHSHDIIVTFANTGVEHPATLDFVDKCDRHFGLNVVWLEAVITHGRRVGIRHREVDYFSASRDGAPFREYIKKYGIPNVGSPQCTSRLKTEVMESYLRSRGCRIANKARAAGYKTAIGIRADEIDRISERRDHCGFIYPLADRGWTKQMVLDFWKRQPFDLDLPGEHYGNCVWCWKKSLRKLLTVAQTSPQAFDFPRQMEAEFSGVKAQKGRRVFFRGNRSADDILAMAKLPFDPFIDSNARAFDVELDVGGGCGESCEVGADESDGAA